MDVDVTPTHEPDVVAQMDQTAMALRAHARALGSFFKELVDAGIDRDVAADMTKERQIFDLYGPDPECACQQPEDG